MKKKFYYILFILFIFCAALLFILKPYWDGSWKEKTQRKNFEETLTFFQNNEFLLEKIAEEFKGQNELSFISQSETVGDSIITLRINSENSKIFIIKIPKDLTLNNSRMINNPQVTVSYDDKEVSFDNWLSSFKINDSNFLYWKNILQVNNFYSISKSFDFDNTIQFYLPSNGRLIYSFNNNNLTDFNSNTETLKKLDKKWYYYYVRSGVGFF